jgi:hypothetical protein
VYSHKGPLSNGLQIAHVEFLSSVIERSDAENAELVRRMEGRRLRASLHAQLYGWLIGWFGWLIGCLVGWLIGGTDGLTDGPAFSLGS